VKVHVRSLKNVSEVSVPVQISPFTTVYLGKGDEMKNQDVFNLPALQGMVKTEQDLGEVTPINEGMTKLYD